MDFQAQPLVSVVTLVYNGEKYLSECIESVLAQTYQNWEYIIVNNCSTDRSFEIAQSYVSKDPRIRIHNNEQFVRVIQNHNIALRQISPKSKYCKVVYADDSIFPECLTKMVELAEANPNVGIVGCYSHTETRVIGVGLPYLRSVTSGREICRSGLLGGPYVFGTPTSQLIRSDLIRSREAFYNESNLHADMEACYEFLEHSDFGFVHQVLTFTRRANESLCSFSVKMNTYSPGFLNCLVKYGPLYLSATELKARLRIDIENYYGALAKNAFLLREKEFWRYHNAKLKELGYPLSKVKLMKAICLEAISLLLNPKQTVEKLVHGRFPSAWWKRSIPI